MPSIAILDAGPLLAWADRADRDHTRCRAVIARSDLQFVIPVLVVTEVTYFVGRRLGAAAEARFLRALAEFEVEAPLPEEWLRIGDLVEQYADFPLGGTDASVIALAERLETDVIITLDRRHFGAVRPRHVSAFRLLPDED
jgi:predicted nucleic acid-binding protein